MILMMYGITIRIAYYATRLERPLMQPRLLLAIYGLCAVVGTAFAQKADVGWKDYLGGPGSEHYSPLKQIDVSNVDKIKVAWTYPAGDGLSTFCPLVVSHVA